MRSTNFAGSDNRPAYQVPQAAKGVDNFTSPAARDVGNVFQKHNWASAVFCNSKYFSDQPTSLARQAFALANNADVLAGEPRCDEVDAPKPFPPVYFFYIIKNWRIA